VTTDVAGGVEVVVVDVDAEEEVVDVGAFTNVVLVGIVELGTGTSVDVVVVGRGGAVVVVVGAVVAGATGPLDAFTRFTTGQFCQAGSGKPYRKEAESAVG